MGCSPPGSSAHGILQARVLEWAAMPFSRASFWPRDRIRVSCIEGSFFTIWATRDPFILGHFIIYQFVNWVYLTLKILLLIPNMYYLKNFFSLFSTALGFCYRAWALSRGGKWGPLSRCAALASREVASLMRTAGSRAMSFGSSCAWPQ